ncbi:MAG: AAA family ATPase, partial [Erysipelotrichaceae bacterium]|nr:AAA family ATPase [Erysipelotrichaceae bacterium]
GNREKELAKLIGLSSVKSSITKIKAYFLANKDSDNLNIHMCFYGNPGTGKTEVARIIAGILYENKILPTDKVVEVDRGGLIGQYVGETPQKTMKVIQSAMGGVLFIDEAYSLVSGGFDYGNEAVATLIKAMEDYRGKFCVILAGYKNKMLNMIATNPGFKSRIQFELDFPNYSRDELRQITNLMLNKRKYSISDEAMSKMLDVTDVKRKEENFANAREVRNILDQVIMCQNMRAMGTDDKSLQIIDVNQYIKDSKISVPTQSEGATNRILTADEELDQLVGLGSVKRTIKKIRAFAKKNKVDSNFNLHMCFYGNPGTGKTEVARILSRLLYDAGVLSEAKLVETDSTGLLGKYVGETAPKTKDKINDAMGGVLFIDEAYALMGSKASGGSSTNYGEEAIAVLLKEMEDNRGKFCVILAGYKQEMNKLISVNPGFQSRIQFTLDFPDYTREELGEIALRFLKKKGYTINDEALDRVLDITDFYRDKPNFANARTVRNILDQVIMNQNLRTEDITDDYSIVVDDVEDYILDENLFI